MIALSISAMIAGLFINILAFFIILCLSAALTGIFLLFTRRHQAQINSLCEQVDISLYAEKMLDIPPGSENELTALQKSIQAMTVKLHEQALSLQQDKQYLKNFIADISRQLRMPLTSINIVSSFLGSGNLSPERHDELIGELNNLLTRTNWLIATLLKISRIDVGTASFRHDMIEVPALVEKAIKPLGNLLKLKNVTLHSEGDITTTFYGDLAWSAEALGNILQYTLEYADSSHIGISYTRNADFTQILITDNGKGYDKTRLSHLFEGSHRGRTVHDLSFSAALALSRMIIARQNGIISAENLKSGGCCFSIKFYHSQPAPLNGF
jgi:K+-sensing histidine kinase KdpD